MFMIEPKPRMVIHLFGTLVPAHWTNISTTFSHYELGVCCATNIDLSLLTKNRITSGKNPVQDPVKFTKYRTGPDQPKSTESGTVPYPYRIYGRFVQMTTTGKFCLGGSCLSCVSSPYFMPACLVGSLDTTWASLPVGQTALQSW